MFTKKCPYCAEEIQEAAIKCKHCNSWLAEPAPGIAPPQSPQPHQEEALARKKLTRSSSDRMIAGVCGGLAQSIDVDSSIVRAGYAILCCFTAFIPGLIAYAVLAAILPTDDEPSTKL